MPTTTGNNPRPSYSPYAIRVSLDNSKEYAVYHRKYGYEVTCYKSYGAAAQGLRKLINK